MAVCEACGTQNRDKARFCCGCAQALAPLTEPAPAAAASPAVVPAPGPLQACPVCQIANPLAATVCKSCRGSLVPDVVKATPTVNGPASRGLAVKALSGVGLGLVVAAVMWWGARDVTADARVLTSAPAVSGAAAPVVSSVPVGTGVALSAASAPPMPGDASVATPAERSAREKTAGDEARAQRQQAAAQARREQAARDRVAAEEKVRVAKVEEQQRADEAARQRAAADAAQQARTTVRAAPPPPLAPVVKTVEQICASSGNFFSREACRLRSCGDGAFGNDPVCVRFSEMEAASRRAVTN